MQVAPVVVANDQTKIVGILEVKWNTNMFTKNMGIRKQEIPLLELWAQYPGSVVPLAMFYNHPISVQER